MPGKLSGHHSNMTQLTFSDDDQFLGSSRYDYTVLFWSVRKTNPYPAMTNGYDSSRADYKTTIAGKYS